MIYICKYGEYNPEQPRISRIASVLSEKYPITWVVSTSETKSDNVIAVGAGSKVKYYFEAMKLLKNKLTTSDVAYGYMHIGALVAWKASRATGAKFVYDYPDPWVGWYHYKTPSDSLTWKLGRRIFFFLERKMYWAADAVLTASYSQLEFLRSQHRKGAKNMINKSKTVEDVIINSPDAKVFRPRKPDSKLVKKLKLKGKKVLMFQGYVGYNYGVDLLVDAMRLIKQKRKDVVLIILGRYGEQEYFDFLKRKIKEYSLEKEVIIHPPVPYAQMPRFLSLPSIGFVPFRQIFYNAVGGPNKLFEYMSSGIVPICSNMIEFRKHVKNWRNGILVHTEDVNQVAAAVFKLLDNPKLMKSIARKNAIKAREQYNWDIQREKIFSALEAIE